MEKIIDKTAGAPVYEFEVVKEWPRGGYSVWNIGRANFRHAGYLPLAQAGDLPYHINPDTLKALYVGDEDLCLFILRHASRHGVSEKKYAGLVLDYFASL